jgi:mercuric ion transport protein
MTVMTTTTQTDMRGAVMNYLSLFTSVGTLLCCALPSLLVLFGMGATVASLLSAAPWLVSLSHYKPIVFSVSGIMIGLGFVYTYRVAPALRRASPACDPANPDACTTADRFGRATLWLSAILWSIGFFTAFLLGRILLMFD